MRALLTLGRQARIQRLLVAALAAPLAVALACSGDPTPEPGPAAPSALEQRRDAAVGAALTARHVEWEPAKRAQAIEQGRAALERAQCNRCHAIDDVPPSSRPTHCVSCHQWLSGLEEDNPTYTKLAGRYGRDVLERYQRNIEHYLEVPDLTRVALRLNPSWIETYIQNPHDLRPLMEETMVRTRISPEDAQAIARYFAAIAETHDPAGELTEAPPSIRLRRPSDERIEAGRQLFIRRGCNLCHTVGNVDTGKTRAELLALGAASKMAPNLRFTRERMTPEIAAAWMLDPQRFHADTRMPPTNLTPEDAAAIRDFIFFVDPRLAPTPPEPPLRLPPAVDRPVAWAEVKELTLGRICVHCHMNDYERDPGPGNQGGFGHEGVGLRMRTYEMLVAGQFLGGDHDEHGAEDADHDADSDEAVGERVVDEEGNVIPIETVTDVGAGRERRSVLAAHGPHALPELLEVMLLRRVEERRDRIEAFQDHVLPADHGTHEPGMPMGLPSIPDEELAVLRAWIEQGCPGPTEVTGMGGITDGYLVPDGPIEPNRGCQVRLPSAERPEWATQPPPAWARPRPAPQPDASAASGETGSGASMEAGEAAPSPPPSPSASPEG